MINEGQFKCGFNASPATQFKRGDRPSPKTEFKEGHLKTKEYEIGTVRVRHSFARDESRMWRKVGRKKWRQNAVCVWEDHNGCLPRGMVVHHKDRNPMNDDIGNLEALTPAAHTAIHRFAWEKGRVDVIRGAVAKLAVDDIPVIRELCKSGLSFAKIAERYSVAKTTIQNVVERRTWKDVA